MDNYSKPTLRAEDEDINITSATFKQGATLPSQDYLGSTGSYWDFDDEKWELDPSAAEAANTPEVRPKQSAAHRLPPPMAEDSARQPSPLPLTPMFRDAMPPTLFLKDLMAESVVCIDSITSPSLDEVLCDPSDLCGDGSGELICCGEGAAKSTNREPCKATAEESATAQCEKKDLSEGAQVPKAAEAAVTQVSAVLPKVHRHSRLMKGAPYAAHAYRAASIVKPPSPQRWNERVASLAPPPRLTAAPSAPAAPRPPRTAYKGVLRKGPIARSKSGSKGRK